MKRRHLVPAAALAVALLVAALAGQQPGIHPVSGRVYALPMGVAGAPWLERREREVEEDPDLAMRLIRVQRGQTVADFGAGSGYFTLRLARAVGTSGKVYAVDIQQGMLDLLQSAVTRARLTNVIPVLAAPDERWLCRLLKQADDELFRADGATALPLEGRKVLRHVGE